MRCFQNSEPFYLVKLLQMRVGRARGLGSFNSIPKNQQILQLKISMTPFSMEKQCKKNVPTEILLEQACAPLSLTIITRCTVSTNLLFAKANESYITLKQHLN